VALFLTSQFISLFGSSLVGFAIFWYITLKTESGLMMTLYILCGFLPTFLVSPFAGVWADRFHRKLLIWSADAVIALVTLILALVFLAGYEAVWLLFLISAIRALGTGVQTPAVSAILPQMVPKEHLVKVNGINSSMQAAISFVAPIVSAALLTWSAIEIILFIDVATASVAVLVLLTMLKIPKHQKAEDNRTESYFGNFAEGLRYIRKHGYLKIYFLFNAAFLFCSAPAAFLTPLQVVRSFGEEVWRLTAIEIAFSSGMMAGGAVMAAWGGFSNRVRTMAFAGLFLGGCTLGLGVVPNFWIYLLVMAICGVALPMFNTPATVLLQEKVEEHYLGRIFGVFSMISTSMMPLGMLLFGPVADLVPIEWLLVTTGVLIMALSLWMGNNRTLLEAGERPPQKGGLLPDEG